MGVANTQYKGDAILILDIDDQMRAMRMTAHGRIYLGAFARGFGILAQKAEQLFKPGMIGVSLTGAKERHAFNID